MVRRFKTEAAEVGRRAELIFPVPMPERGLPPGAVVLLGLVLAIGAYAGWYRLSGEGRLPAETVTAIPERLAPLAEQALPATVPAQSGRASCARRPEAWHRRGAAVALGGLGGRSGTPANPAPPVAAISPTSAAAGPASVPPGR